MEVRERWKRERDGSEGETKTSKRRYQAIQRVQMGHKAKRALRAK